MNKLWERLSTKQFQSLFESGKFVSGRLISINAKFEGDKNLVGFAVKRSKVKKNSVERNRIRRRLREAFLKIQDLLPEGLQIVIIGDSDVEFAPIDEISAEILRLTKRIDNKC
jgi:ribonuclease P protein component